MNHYPHVDHRPEQCRSGRYRFCRRRARVEDRTRTLIGRVLVALALAASVLAVGPSPAQGAAAEVETRRLSGLTRYETALEIAKEYVAEVKKRDLNAVIDTVIVTSGEDEHFAYALPAPALSRLYEAPLLLTPPDRLDRSVTAFITGNNITRVVIIGGADVVSEAVEQSIDAISNVFVDRIRARIGDEHAEYSTAVAVAKRVGPSAGSPGDFPGKGRTVLLATGEKFADALAAGPLAYRGRHPILLTRSDVLPVVAATFLSDSSTEHVVILGGPKAVSTGIEQQIRRMGIEEVTRWQGLDRVGTAAEIAKALLGPNQPQGCFEGDELGLAFGWRSPDAIVSGPLLGELCAPLLLTQTGALPLLTEAILGDDDLVDGASDGKLRITVFGGEMVITEATEEAAKKAAQLASLGATITAAEGACHFTVTFDQPVLMGTDPTADGSALNPVNYLSGNTAFNANGAHVVNVGPSKVVVWLGVTSAPSAGTVLPENCTPLSARDRIGIIEGKIEAASGNRKVARVEYFVEEDETPPTLTLIATADSNMVWLESSEPLLDFDPPGDTGRDNQVRIELRLRPGLSETRQTATLTAGDTRLEFTVPTGEPFGESAMLPIGASVEIAANQVTDLAGNPNAATTLIVARDTTAPQASRITVTEPVAVGSPGERAVVKLQGKSSANADPRESLVIKARSGTALDGIAGAQWTADLDVRATRPTGWRTDTSPPQQVSVQVFTATRTILVTALSSGTNDDDDNADIGEIVTALNQSPAFNVSFLASRDPSASESDIPVDSGGRVAMSVDSTVDLTVYWTEQVHDCSNSTGDPDRRPNPRLIEIDADGNGTTDFALDGVTFSTSDVVFVDSQNREITSVDNTVQGQSKGATCPADDGVRDGTLRARIKSASINNLPGLRSTADVRSGAVTDLANNANARQIGIRLVRP